MHQLKIGIVEDELLVAKTISVLLKKMGYSPLAPVRNYSDALNMISTQSPDMVLIDVMIDGMKDGIEVADAINKQFGIPFIFLTANSDAATVDRAKAVKPLAYLVKPFNEKDLFTTIEIAFNNYSAQTRTPSNLPTAALNNMVFIKERDTFFKLDTNDIVYLESDNVYLNIYTTDKHYLIRKKMDDFLAQHANNIFFRTHRSYAVNINHIQAIHISTVSIAGKTIPLQKSYRDELLQVIQFVK